MLERAKKLATATLADALDALGLPGIMSGIHRQSGLGRVAGFARTMHEQTAPHGSFPFEGFAVGRAFDAIEAHEILVIDMSGADVSTFGGLAATALSIRGAAAAIIDGGCRDIEEMQATGLTVAARFRTPRSGKGRARVISIDQPVTCGGIAISVGDLIVIDDTGTVVLPRNQAGAILDLAEQLDARDRLFLEELKIGKGFSELFNNMRHV